MHEGVGMFTRHLSSCDEQTDMLLYYDVKSSPYKVTCPGSRESMVDSQTPMYIVSIKEQSPAI